MRNKLIKQILPHASDGQSSELETFRMQIDEIDQLIVPLLDRRAQIVFKVGEWKKSKGLPILDSNREKKVLDRISKIPREFLSQDEIQNLYLKLIEFYRNTEEARSFIESAQKSRHLPQKAQVAFFGFGLISSSIALSLLNFSEWDFFIYDPLMNVDEFEKWNIEKCDGRFKLVNRKQIKNMDFVFLGAPVDVINAEASEILKENKLVLDLGSVQMSLPKVYGFHPLAGKELSGFVHGSSLLFRNKVIAIRSNDNSEIQKMLIDLAQSLGAFSFEIDIKEHNKALGYSSHLLRLLSLTLGDVFKEAGLDKNKDLIPPAATEFLRLTGGNQRMWQSIFLQNRENILYGLEHLSEKLNEVKVFLEQNKIQNVFKNSLEIYESIYQKRKAK